jgi:hypothetical protein
MKLTKSKKKQMNPPAPPSNSRTLFGNRYSVGTLTYTKMGIGALFAWLLWSNLCFQVMERLSRLPSFL